MPETTKKYRVSTITPCFRMKRYLPLFLEKLPEQTIFNEMEIVLDHNEPDEEEIKWVKEFQAKYPGVIRHIIVPKVDPIGTSMNRCIREAKSDLVCIWNIDDLRTPDSLEQQAKVLEENHDVGIVFGDYKIVRSFGATEGDLISDKITGEELTRSMIIGPFYMFRKSLCKVAGMFDEHLRQAPDFDLAIRLAFHARAARTPGMLGYYLNEGKGASTKPDSLQGLERVVVELRYGIYDKIDYDYLPRSQSYVTPYILDQGKWVAVDTLVPNYKALLEERKKKWFMKGVRVYVTKKAIFYKPVRRRLAIIVKKMRGIPVHS